MDSWKKSIERWRMAGLRNPIELLKYGPPYNSPLHLYFVNIKCYLFFNTVSFLTDIKTLYPSIYYRRIGKYFLTHFKNLYPSIYYVSYDNKWKDLLA